jgi:N-methylhydantoinase A
MLRFGRESTQAMTTAVGIDTGGTFTDFVVLDDAGIRVHKVLSTPEAPERAILQGLQALGLSESLAGDDRIVHGSTVATNAALEGRTARTAYLADAGLADVLSLGRQNRDDLYDLTPPPVPEPVPEALCVETTARMDSQGSPVTPLDGEELERLIAAIAALDVEAVAINLVFSWRNPEHERRIAAALEAALSNVSVSSSSEVLPAAGEYERGIATWLNASLGPRVRDYLERLASATAPTPLAVLQSAGGTMSAATASRRAANLLLSGPAGGIAAAERVARLAGISRLLTFDMGGTSTDVALLGGERALTTSSRIGPWPVAIPMLEIHTIGAGGGSLARVDAGGALRVGPESAGASPGPVCYGQGGKIPTVTDANLVLGRLPAEAALGGYLSLSRSKAFDALERLGAAMGHPPGNAALRAAAGVVRLADENMAAAVRVMSLDRGVDPRDAVLCCFGGAGGLHLCGVGDVLGVTRALVPAQAGVLSALGMLAARPERQMTRSIDAPLVEHGPAALEAAFSALEEEAETELASEGHDRSIVRHRRTIELRYRGQSFALGVHAHTLDADTLGEAFETAHEARYGHRLGAIVEIDALRVQALIDRAPLDDLTDVSPATTHSAGPASLEVLPELGGEVPRIERRALSAGRSISGPAIITEATSTVWLAPAWGATGDERGNLDLRREPNSR